MKKFLTLIKLSLFSILILGLGSSQLFADCIKPGPRFIWESERTTDCPDQPITLSHTAEDEALSAYVFTGTRGSVTYTVSIHRSLFGVGSPLANYSPDGENPQVSFSDVFAILEWPTTWDGVVPRGGSATAEIKLKRISHEETARLEMEITLVEETGFDYDGVNLSISEDQIAPLLETPQEILVKDFGKEDLLQEHPNQDFRIDPSILTDSDDTGTLGDEPAPPEGDEGVPGADSYPVDEEFAGTEDVTEPPAREESETIDSPDPELADILIDQALDQNSDGPGEVVGDPSGGTSSFALSGGGLACSLSENLSSGNTDILFGLAFILLAIPFVRIRRRS